MIKQILLATILSINIIYSQNVNKLVQYQISIPDSIIKDSEGNVMYREVPYRSKIFLDSLFKKATSNITFQYRKTINGIENVIPPYTFPILTVDSIQINHTYPPYALFDTIFTSQLDPSSVMGIKYYEKWEASNWNVDTNSYTKTILAWSFIIEKLNNMGEKMGNYELEYLFLMNNNYLPYLKQQLER